MKTLIRIITWFEQQPMRMLYLIAYLLVLALLCEVIDAQLNLARIITGH